MPLSPRDERTLALALRTLTRFWPTLVIPKEERKDRTILCGIAMFVDLEGAIRIRAALDQHIRERTS